MKIASIIGVPLGLHGLRIHVGWSAPRRAPYLILLVETPGQTPHDDQEAGKADQEREVVHQSQGLVNAQDR
ncbi:MAG TPA: hypothetical protein VMI31_04665 [Fimbriimonadaceae bacterium]|nr:hypothetical protein [Fimbriimonadaceae bacterium]